MVMKYNYEEIERKVEEIWDELEPKIVKEICKSLIVDKEYETLTINELHSAIGLPLGFCHMVWNAQKKVLKKEYNINGKSPSDLNPEIFFD